VLARGTAQVAITTAPLVWVVTPFIVTVKGEDGAEKVPVVCATSIAQVFELLEGRKTCITSVSAMLLATPETEGLALHVPLNVHQNILAVKFVVVKAVSVVHV
jgi:hypothetical protein